MLMPGGKICKKQYEDEMDRAISASPYVSSTTKEGSVITTCLYQEAGYTSDVL
jgi:hypothetical protein